MKPSALRFRSILKIHDGSLGFKEPSGIALDPDTGMLWSVSDDTRNLYCLGRPDDFKPTKGPRIDAKDIEGTTFLSSEKIALVEEKANSIAIVDCASGDTLLHRRLKDMRGYGDVRKAFKNGKDGKGIEGITFDPGGDRFFVAKEGRPRLLLEITPDLEEIVGSHDLAADAGFSVDGVSDEDLDVSGLAWDTTRQILWISSDTGRCVFLYDPVKRSASVLPLLRPKDGNDISVRNAEGVTLGPEGKTLFVVTDDGKGSVLLSYEILDA